MNSLKKRYNSDGPGICFPFRLLLRRAHVQALQDAARMILHPKIVAILTCASFIFSISAQESPAPAIIPLPAEYLPSNGVFHISHATQIICEGSKLIPCGKLLQEYIKANGLVIPVLNKSTPANNIVLTSDSTLIHQPEGYEIRIDNRSIKLIANNAAGIIYGIQTLRQLWQQKNQHLVIPAAIIKDHPRFAYRGMALDVSRHMFPLSFIKKYIDLLSLYKFNTFHWHLTDDQGWRIEIKKYPKLQSIAAWRKETLIGHKKEFPHRFDGKRYGGYYTQAEIKEVIAYAAQRNITIIPEIEMPGHAQAALSAYPSLGCTGGPYQPATFWGVFDDVFCVGNDSTFIFLQNVLDEVIQLFPSPYIHIGGDECPKTRWKVCPKCQRRIKDLQLKDEHALQGYFITRMEKYINSKGKNIIGWDEILEGGLAPNATVMSWRGEEGGIAAAGQQHNVVMTPESNMYFDYYQSLYPAEPLSAASYTPLEKVYSYEPAADKNGAAVNQYIKGVEGQAFSEYFTSVEKAEYMIFPRAIAVAEIGWTNTASRNYASFTQRLWQLQSLLKKLQVHAAENYDEIKYTAKVTGRKQVSFYLTSSLPASTIFYSTDGSTPTPTGRQYKDSILITRSCTLKALLYDASHHPVGRTFEQPVIVHEAVGANIRISNAPTDKYNPGSMALLNGIAGNTRYNDAQWVGFSGNNLEAVIDLGSAIKFRRIQTNFLVYHWQRMWGPALFKIEVSADGINYTQIFTQNKFPVNGINTIIAALPDTQARFIKLTAVNQGIIPADSYGAGGKALLMTDEIIVK